MHKEKNYLFTADFIRAVAIILVVTIHVFSEFVNHPKVFGTTDWWIANVIDSSARVAVPLFIMLSGMLILHSNKTYTAMEFMRKRVSKIGIPLLIWPIIYFFWKLWITPFPVSFMGVIDRYISLTVYYHLYYLYVIIGLYLLTPIFKVFTTHATKSSRLYAVVLFFLFSIVLTFVKYFKHIGINFGTIFTIFIPFIPYYLAGDYLRDKRLSQNKMILSSLGIFLLIAVTTVGNYWYMQLVGWNNNIKIAEASYDRYFYDYLSITVVGMSLLIFPLLHTVSEKYSLFHKRFAKTIIVQLAGTSLGIFLLHPLLLEFSNRVLKINYSFLPIPAWAFLFIKTLGILITSYLLIYLIRKIPLINRIV